MTKQDKSTKELLELGKQVAVILDMSRASRKTIMLNGFLRGMAQGFGVVIGGTVLVGLLLWILGFFEEIPFLEQVVNSIVDIVKANT